MRRGIRTLFVLLAALVALPVGAHAADRAPSEIPDRYIVVLKDSVDNVDRAVRSRQRALGFRSRFRYREAVKGFAARLSRGQVRKLRRDAQVVTVAADRRVEAYDTLTSGDSAPTGVRRVEAAAGSETRGRSGARVAVIDTGIDLDHPDLNASNGYNCVQPGSNAEDDEGHGTHVAGTIAARNNGGGVVGVAADTQVVAVKVLDSAGSGTWSQVICGIDWVTGTRTDADTANDIAVANMSLGGSGDPVGSCSSTDDPLHRAICSSTAAGVVYAVAAGNSGWDYDYGPAPDVPAAYPEVLTVTAMADSDGSPGGLGSKCSRQSDDRYASYSNYALRSASFPHTLAAPGNCITSTRLGGGTEVLSGTSMATPHVAAAVALCLDDDGTQGPCAGLAANQPSSFVERVTSTDSAYGFAGDPTRPLSGGQYFGYLSRVGLGSSTSEPDTTAPATPAGLVATAGNASVGLAWDSNAETDLAGYNVYRSESPGVVGAKVNDLLVADSAFQDPSVANGTTYYYVVTAVDGTGNESAYSSEVSATPSASQEATGITLNATGYKVKGVQHAELTWSDATSTSVDVYRDGNRVATTPNDGAHADNIGKKGGGSYTYKLCEAGTSTCSNEVTVTF